MEWRAITDDEFVDYVHEVEMAFGFTPEDGFADQVRPATEIDRTLVAVEDGRFVATGASLTFELTAPGAVLVPTAGVTDISVRRTHRRRGLLTEAMRRLSADAQRRGEPVMALIASESGIYGRFGFGVGTWLSELAVARHLAQPAPLPHGGTLEELDDDTARLVVPGVWDRYRRRRVGELSRSDGRWDTFFADPDRKEKGRRFHLVHRDPTGAIDGWAAYRQRPEWSTGLTNGSVFVDQLIATDDHAHLALWHELLGTDLAVELRAYGLPDDPVRHTLRDGRRLTTHHLRDHLWIRLLDIPAALAARRYPVDDVVVLDVTDPFEPHRGGRFELIVEDGALASCRPTGAEPDASLSSSDLASLWLGGVSASTLARAGRLAFADEAVVARLGLLFLVDPAPLCLTDF